MTTEHFDVVVVGAGISGIGAGCHLTMKSPDRSFVILEARDQIGGTWDLFRYPGIRSDSDMFTLGFSFKPWRDDDAIAGGGKILTYLNETIDEYHLRDKIRFGHEVKAANWDSKTSRWQVDVQRKGSNEVTQISCQFLFMCSGYYDYDEGYLPDWPGYGDYPGTRVHPQKWPEDLDYKDKKVIVIGSGATAVTLVPELAKEASHVTMLQRSPTYMAARPHQDPLANWLRGKLPAKWVYGITRWKKILLGNYFYKRSRAQPEKIKAWLVNQVREELGPDYDVKKHFTPSYNPWDQRLCLVTNGDLFDHIKDGSASVVTDHIDRFTPEGIRLKSGEELRADIIVTATGLKMKFLAGLAFTKDGAPIDLTDSLYYKGMMFSGVPNLAASFGYTNASWTLKCDLTCDYVCRLLNHMSETGTHVATPMLNDPSVEEEPWLDFTSSYIERARDQFPKQGNKMPWQLHQDYFKDRKMLHKGALEDGVMEFT
ncbi:MAG: NAD(P)/FAD-dependent oxidoreductase [Alphaproteobacteria bacterium]|nr:MAG: NAD(P)/FAD-dependent oxidoreductase [Alphaproteobacteria bacterium]